MRKIGVGENVVLSVKAMRQYIQFCVRFGEKEVSSFVPQIKGIRRGFVLSACVFKIFEYYCRMR
jgi:hypothetical protein